MSKPSYEDFVEKIKNNNGLAIKFSDGTMICTKQISLTGVSVSGTVGNLYQSSDIDLGQYAETFIELYASNIEIRSDDFYGIVGLRKNANNANIGSIRIMRPSSNASNDYIVEILAIGRWK